MSSVRLVIRRSYPPLCYQGHPILEQTNILILAKKSPVSKVLASLCSLSVQQEGEESGLIAYKTLSFLRLLLRKLLPSNKACVAALFSMTEVSTSPLSLSITNQSKVVLSQLLTFII